MQVYVKDLLKDNRVEDYAEFYFLLALGKCLNENGSTLCFDDVLLEVDSFPRDMINYLKILLTQGAVTVNGWENKGSSILEESKTNIDISYFPKIPLFCEEYNGVIDGKLHWSFDYALESYGEYSTSFLHLTKLGNTLVHLVAWNICKCFLENKEKTVVIHLNNHQAKTTSTYVMLYALLKAIPWMHNFLELDIDFQDISVDIDYSIFCNKGTVKGRSRIYSCSEKIELLKKFGMVEGSVLELWERKGMCPNNRFGRLEGVSVIILNEIGEDFLGITKIALNKTKEELYQEYCEIPEESRYLFVDTLDKAPHTESLELDLFGVGVDNYFMDETRFITLLDDMETVDKLVTVDGKVCSVNMKEVDAVYWLFKQYDIEFDSDLFISMYMNGEEPLWDRVHPKEV